jgi:hypothetical protein
MNVFCIQYFNVDHIESVYDYQISLITASLCGKSPKVVVRSEYGCYA